MGMAHKEMTAMELCGNYNDQEFKLKGGRVVWESISYAQNTDKCYLSRIVQSGGKPFLLGLRYKCMYVKPETKVIVL